MGDTDLYSIQEVMAKLGGISRNTVYKLMKEGGLASVTIGRRRFVRGHAIEAFLAAATTTRVKPLADHRSTQIPLPLESPRARRR